MNSRRLLKSQKNEILSLIQESGLDPALFFWKDTPSQQSPENIISQLRYRESDFFYSFEMKGEVHHAVFSPSRQSYIGSAYPVTWSRQKARFSEWLDNLIKEENEPDMWKSVHDSAVHEEPTYVVTKPPASHPDLDQMVSRVNEIMDQQSDPGKKHPASPIRRYYGKA